MFRCRKANLLAVVAIAAATIVESDTKFLHSNRIAGFEASPPALADLYRQFEQPSVQQQLYRPIGLFRYAIAHFH
ncbi:hypothetical protein AAVH_38268 [Aphelenchoides avenae]|nr:hypothetical protein AAVH_38268 [Aphelenchus avenae]